MAERKAERIRQPPQGGELRIERAALTAAQIGNIDGRKRRECFPAPAALLTQTNEIFPNNLTKRNRSPQ